LNQAKNEKKVKYLPRDASAFREYASQMPHQHSMYTQFYLKEALKQQRTKELWD
jgi:hypothetical protein